MKKTNLFLALLIAGGLVSCSDNNVSSSSAIEKEPTINEKLAYASSGALNFVSKPTATTSNISLGEGFLSNLPVDGNEIFDQYISQFDVLLEAKSNVEIEVNENEEGSEYRYSAQITIGESSQFSYSLNYNQEELDNLVRQEGVLVIAYVPLEYDFTLNFESQITYDSDNLNGSVNFKLYTDVLNPDNKKTYVEVNENVDATNANKNIFQYKVVVNEKTLFNYEVQIPLDQDGEILVILNNATYSLKREIVDNVTKIYISLVVANTKTFTIVYEKVVDEEGNISYKYIESSIG